MKTFAVCFHHTKEDLSIWERFSKYLSKNIGEQVYLTTYSSFYEEQNRSVEEDYDLVFQNSETVFLFLKKCYKPIARLNNQWDTVYYISKKGLNRDKQFISVGIVPIRVLYGTLLELEKIGFDINRIDFKIYQNLAQIHDALIRGDIDIGVTRKDTFTRLSSDFQSSMDILFEFETGIFHSFMIKNTDDIFGQRIIKVLFNMHLDSEGLAILNDLSSDKIVPIGYEFGFLSRLNEVGEKIFKYRNYYSFFKAIENLGNVGVIIYQEKVIFFNKFAREILRYSEKEISQLDMVDLFEKDISDQVQKNIHRRLSGEFFDVYYKNIKLVSKNNESIDVTGYASTIIFDGRPSGSFIFVDNRKNIFLEKLFFTIKEINHIITLSDTVEDVFERLGEKVVSSLGFCYSKSLIFDEGLLRKTVSYGVPIKKVDKVDILNKNIMMDMVYDDGELKGYIFIIPIFIENRLVSIIEIHTDKYLDYVSELSILFEELKGDIGFILEKIEKDENAKIFYNAIESSKDIYFITDENGRITYCNDALCKLYGYSYHDIIGNTPALFKSGKMSSEFYEKFYNIINSGKEFEGLFINKNKNGDILYIENVVIPIIKRGEIKGFVNIGKNVTNEVILKDEIEKVKYRDYLTGLLNYLGFQIKGSEFLMMNNDNISAVVLLDIYNMSFINNTYGYEFGNEVLRFVANSLEKLTKPRDTIARIGGDDFVILYGNIKSKENVFKIVDRLITFFSKKHKIIGNDIYIFIKISVAIYPDDGKEISDLLNKTSLALSQTREKDTNIIFYDEKMEEKAEKFLFVEDLLSSAVKENRYIMHYQPYFHAETLNLAGFEALVRLRDQDGNILYPNIFIDHLEDSQHLDEFEDWLIDDTANLINHTGYAVSINLSAKNLTQEKLINKISKINKCFCDKLTIEITEREMGGDFYLFAKKLEEFKKITELKLAIDDFGTGYSSLSRLKYLSCDILKIDIIFIREMFKTEKDTAFVNAIIDLSKRFGYTIVAEGVETQEQFHFLRDNGCDIVQGYLLGKPVDRETLLSTDWERYSEDLRKKIFKI